MSFLLLESFGFLSSFTISGAESGQGHLWDLIETWGFRIDDRGGKGGLLLIVDFQFFGYIFRFLVYFWTFVYISGLLGIFSYFWVYFWVLGYISMFWGKFLCFNGKIMPMEL